VANAKFTFLFLDAVKWLDIHRTAMTPVAKLVVRTKNPAPNPAHPGFNPPHPSASAHPTSWGSQHPSLGTAHSRSTASSSQVQGLDSNRFSSPSFVYAGKKIDTRNLDVGIMQKASVRALLIQIAILCSYLTYNRQLWLK
jgi:hypothetical protein